MSSSQLLQAWWAAIGIPGPDNITEISPALAVDATHHTRQPALMLLQLAVIAVEKVSLSRHRPTGDQYL